MVDALFYVMDASGVDLQEMLIFLPSRRALRTVEVELVKRAGGAVLLPHLVALGEAVDDPDYYDEFSNQEIVSNLERVVVAARLLVADANIKNYATALPIARDLIRMCDYMENEGVNPSDLDWNCLVDEKYAKHFQDKAKMLNIMSRVMNEFGADRVTSVQKRNADIRAWINVLDKYKLVIVCGSTASVPPTADLMVAVAEHMHGRIILSGKISGRVCDFDLNTNPYNSEFNFLKRIGCDVCDVQQIDVGKSAIDFMNYCFGNETGEYDADKNLSHCHLVESNSEAAEASAVAEIAARSIKDNKSVLVITPDAAANQRIASAMLARSIVADFSGGVSGTATPAGRAILNFLDDLIESSLDVFDKLYVKNNKNLFNTIAEVVTLYHSVFSPECNIIDDVSIKVWEAIRELSNALDVADVDLNLRDARVFIADVLGGVCVRTLPCAEARVSVIGTIESRMQTADVVILTGLNETMFPARGYENSWLPRKITEQIGLPSPDRKVSLQALDFMNLSCGKEVYWTRSRVSGGVQTTESRFLSRVIARQGIFDIDVGKSVIESVCMRDTVASNGLDYSPPVAEADWTDVYVTELEHLIHNPYSFFVKHILKLHVKEDWWMPVDARAFGNLVHEVIENATDLNVYVLVAQMDKKAHEILGGDSVLFHFWHKRFLEIAPIVVDVLGKIPNRYHEISGYVKIPVGNSFRIVRARADMVWQDGVMDFKTGTPPNKSQMIQGNMPQLPLEALILQSGGFNLPSCVETTKQPVVSFLQMKNGAVKKIEYDAQTTQIMIDAAVQKVTELFNIYTAGNAPYEYRETGDSKYKQFDDLARIKD